MADNNLARSRNDVPDFFADGDPLAELARIVGYDERVVANPEPPAAPSAVRHDPIFNLEDELLREFERYDAPRLDPVDDLAVAPSVLDAEPVRHAAPAEPVFEEPSFDEPAFDLSELHADIGNDQGDVAPAAAERPFWEQQVADLAHSPVPVEVPQAQFDTPSDDDGFEAFVPANVEPDLPETFAVPEAVAAFEPVQEAVAYQAEISQPEIAFDEIDLAQELETSVVMPPVVQPSSEVKRGGGGFTPSFRMPLANFQPGAGVAPRPVEAKPIAPIAPQENRVTEATSFQQWSPAAAPVVAPVAAASPVVTPAVVPALNIPMAGPAEPLAAKAPLEMAPVAPVVAAKPKDERFSSLDELLYDVDRYSTGSAPVAKAPVSEAAPTPVAAAVQDVDPFADVEFELALDDLELDLADMVVAENSKPAAPAAAMIQPAAPVMAPVATAPVAASPAPAAPAPTAYVAPVTPAAPIMAAAPVMAPTTPDMDDDVAFDPALLADSEEHLEAIPELDVPALPVEEKEEAPLYRNDFDLDIDAELASLLEAPEPAAPSQPAVSAAHAAPVAAAVAAGMAAAPAQKSVYADLDDFERALEEDFRRSLATPLAADERYAAADNYDAFEPEEQTRSSAKRWIAPLAAVGVLAICGAGAYAWLGSAGPGAGNGEPIVIAADNDPVKVAPANPGGKTVPNQDKAVYDRVAGGGSEAPKQQQLISSSEEPVDVVQKTLMPDTLPLEDDIQMSDAGEMQDDRLMPVEQDGAQANDQQALTVMPRKVKTMIVRADGTLVEQEIEAPAAAADKIAAAPVRGDAPVASQSAAPFPTAQAPAQTQASAGSPVVPVSAPADMAATMPAAAQAPAAIEQLAAPAEASNVRAPVPTTRPSQQPVNVVAAVSDQGNVRPAAAAPVAAPAAAQNTQVASVGAGGYVIQIASLPSQADAQKSYQNLSTKFGSVIGGRGVDIKAAEIAGKGTFYRVRIPAGSKAEAVTLCERYRSAGGSCLVAR